MNPELMRELKQIKQRLEELERGRGEIGRWLDWSPTLTQSGSVTFGGGVSFARYKLSDGGGTVQIRARLAVTGSGSAGSAVTIGNLPFAAANGLGAIGVIEILDSGTAFYVGALDLATTTTLVGRAHNETNTMGVDPNFALANNDLIAIVGTYERA